MFTIRIATGIAKKPNGECQAVIAYLVSEGIDLKELDLVNRCYAGSATVVCRRDLTDSQIAAVWQLEKVTMVKKGSDP